MNKDDFDRFWTACVPREVRASNENIFDDVIKAIDNAEKYNHLTESKLLEQYRERGQKIHELFQIKKHLKKGIKEMKSWASNPEFNENHPYIDINTIIKELEKILEGEYKIIDNPKWKTCCKDTGEEK